MPYTEIPQSEQRDSGGSSLISIASLGQHPDNDIGSDSISSSLRSEEIFEEAANVEGFLGEPHYLPVIIPTEPTLDELLRRVSGEEDLKNVESLKLRVISFMVSLSRLSTFTPRLTFLNLDGSVLNSLRDLGYGLIHLKYLNVSNCGLSSLDGTNGIPTVEILIADGNMIQIVNPLGNLPLLKRLSLRDNRISDLGLLTFLGMCPLLQEVNLEGNSVTKHHLYRIEMYKNVKSLELLDNLPLDEHCDSDEAVISDLTGSEPTSSLSEIDLSSKESDSETHKYILGIPCKQRPASSHEIYHVEIKKKPTRPDSTDCVTRKVAFNSGDPLCGSAISTVRQQRKRLVKTAWDISSSSSGSLSYSEYANDRVFPDQLCQTSVDLELGIIGTSAALLTSDTESNGSFKDIARKWRQECTRKMNLSEN